MKPMILLLLWGLVSIGTHNTIQFGHTTYDFGEVPEGRIVNAKYHFRNTGEVPLLITEVITDCGCTASAFPKYPVAPDAEDHISVKFFTKGRAGVQQKQIRVVCNGEPREIILQLNGKVLAN